MDERCTCERCVREAASSVAPCFRLRTRTVARVSLMEWQDWRLGGRDLRSAARGGTCVSARVCVAAACCRWRREAR
eukprot:886492-Prymnesium_polylepis.1